jgi:hypothetical protein
MLLIITPNIIRIRSCVLKIHFNIILSSTPRSSKKYLPLQVNEHFEDLCTDGRICCCCYNHCSLFKITLALDSVLLFWKPLVFESLLGISKTFICSMSALLVKIIFLLDAHQLLMLLLGRRWRFGNKKECFS